MPVADTSLMSGSGQTAAVNQSMKIGDYVKDTIQMLRAENQVVEELLDRISRNMISTKLLQMLTAKMDQIDKHIWEVRIALKDWNVNDELDDIYARQKHKFLKEKLTMQFEQEVFKVKQTGEQVDQVLQLLNSNESTKLMPDAQQREAQELKQLCEAERLLQTTQEDIALQNAIAADNTSALQNIQSQVEEAHHIMQEFTNMVSSQQQDLNYAARQTDMAVDDTGAATNQLGIYYQKKLSSRKRKCLFLILLLVLCFMIIWYGKTALVSSTIWNYFFGDSESEPRSNQLHDDADQPPSS